jgi:hypothetical protein
VDLFVSLSPGEPFINGQAVPYDPKYHEEWVRNNARANERNRRNGPRNNDRSRNFERRRENVVNRDMQQSRPPVHNSGPPPNNAYPPNNGGRYAPPNAGGGYPPPPNTGYRAPQNNYLGNMGGGQQNQNMAGMSPNAGWSNNQ